MSRMVTSGIVGIIAAIIGLIGFSMVWMEVWFLGSMVGEFTGFEIIEELGAIEEYYDPRIILGLLIGGLLVSLICFFKRSIGLRIAFVGLGIAVLFLTYTFAEETLEIIEMGTYQTGIIPGIGMFMSFIAGVMLISAAACSRKNKQSG